MPIDPVIAQIIKRCQKSPSFFIDNFCKVKHPKLGILPFKLFSYQKKCLRHFMNKRFNVFKKCRQCGISTLTGSFALWYAMFYNDKTVLIVSKRDDDAKEYLARNVKFAYNNLPSWMKELWKPDTMNEHTLSFTNGSSIKSLTSSPDTLRSNASSLNIIDEAAFIDRMEDMWAGGWSTLQHGGSVIIVSTPKGVGNWYWKTWAGAVDKANDFNPIIINWWDMDWKLEFEDELNGLKTIIAPTRELKELIDPREVEKYGPGPTGKTFWSPWLEGEYRNLATKGDDSKFRQEVLAEFIGSGDTVLSRKALAQINLVTSDEYTTIGMVDYSNPALDEHLTLDFQDLLWVWEKPYTKEDAEAAISAAKKKGIDPRSLPTEISKPHTYVVGADTSTGEASDFCGLQVIDATTQRQVAELKIKVLPKMFARMTDYIGRMYNNAHVVCERTGIGQSVTQELDKDLMYPNLYRHSKTTATLKVKYNQIGYPTSASTKPVLIKHLIDNVGDEDGYILRSTRLYHECCIYIHLGNGRYGNEPGTGNTDDLVMALTLTLVGINSALMRDNIGLMPLNNISSGADSNAPVIAGKGSSKFDKLKGKGLMAPMGSSSEMYSGKVNQAEELARFTMQVGQGITIDKNSKRPILGPGVTKKKHILKYFRG